MMSDFDKVKGFTFTAFDKKLVSKSYQTCYTCSLDAVDVDKHYTTHSLSSETDLLYSLL